MRGTSCLPKQLVELLHDSIVGSKLGPVTLTPSVDEKISALATRTAAIGALMLAANGAEMDSKTITIPIQQPGAQPAELFALSDMTKFWNPDWKLERAGFGGAGGGIGNIRGITHLEGGVLATWPRDPVRGVVLRRTMKLGTTPSLSLQSAPMPAARGELEVYAGNQRLLNRLIDGGVEKSDERKWFPRPNRFDQIRKPELQIRLISGFCCRTEFRVTHTGKT